MAANIYDRLLLAKVEVTKGVDSIPTPAANAIRVKSFKVKKTTSIIDRPTTKQTMGNLQHLTGKEVTQLDVELELRGSGIVGTAPESQHLLQACRLIQAISAGVNVTYKPSSAIASEKSASIYVYTDGLLWKLLGAVGTCKIDSAMDGVLMCTMTFQAAYVVPTVVAVPSGAVYDAAQPLVMSSATVINDGAVIKVGKFSLDFGNDVQNHYVTSENSFVVANRNPSMSFSKDSINTAAEWAALTAGTLVSFSAGFSGGAGNICTITAPAGKRKDVGYAERAERILNEVSYGLYESTSDDQFTITLT